MKTAISVSIGLVLGIGCAALWASGVLWWPLDHRILVNANKASLDQELQSYKDRLEFFGKRADDLERLLTLLLAGSTIYALAVAYNGYQQAKDAKDKLESLKTEAQTEVNKLKTDTTDEITKLKNGWTTEIAGLTTQFNNEVGNLRTNAISQMDQINAQVAGKTRLMEEQFKELRTSAEAQVKRIEEQIARNFLCSKTWTSRSTP